VTIAHGTTLAPRTVPNELHIAPPYRDLLASIGWKTPEAVFADVTLRVWRDLPDRDNSTLDLQHHGRTVRLHVKRDKVRRREPMRLEADGIALLTGGGIGTAPIVAEGSLDDGRTFVVTENLDGFTSADRLIEAGGEREPIVAAILDVAARLHRANLHHRDLYANHFYLRPVPIGFDVRLIDSARVRPLPWLTRQRWIVKDVAQLAFSLTPYGIDAGAVADTYRATLGQPASGGFRRRVQRKVALIDRHDKALRERKPTRNLRLADGN
jgi:hypothetical protein